MGKPSRERSLAENAAKAVSRNLRISPQKLNLVAAMIRGKKVDQALADLEFSRKRIAQDVRKCVMSAVANAENNHGLDVNELVVSEAWVGKNLVMKRFAARGRGRGSQILKPFSEITIIVRQTAEAKKPKPRAKDKAAETAGAAGKGAPRAKEAKAATDKRTAADRQTAEDKKGPATKKPAKNAKAKPAKKDTE